VGNFLTVQMGLDPLKVVAPPDMGGIVDLPGQHQRETDPGGDFDREVLTLLRTDPS
jgi:hypothetical protein